VKLLMIRHGPAGDRAEWEAEGRDDRLRPLTLEGKKEIRRVAEGLATIVSRIDLLATSPLVRAAQTAEILASRYDDCEPVMVDALAPDNDPDEMVKWLRGQRGDVVAVVGHEPDLSTLAGYLLTGKSSSFLILKKSGTCLLELDDPAEPGKARLEWLLTPRVVKQLAR
jgi:phosphohistidine phosphatase